VFGGSLLRLDLSPGFRSYIILGCNLSFLINNRAPDFFIKKRFFFSGASSQGEGTFFVQGKRMKDSRCSPRPYPSGRMSSWAPPPDNDGGEASCCMPHLGEGSQGKKKKKAHARACTGIRSGTRINNWHTRRRRFHAWLGRCGYGQRPRGCHVVGLHGRALAFVHGVTAPCSLPCGNRF
jgi:hypothetical protein